MLEEKLAANIQSVACVSLTQLSQNKLMNSDLAGILMKKKREKWPLAARSGLGRLS